MPDPDGTSAADQAATPAPGRDYDTTMPMVSYRFDPQAGDPSVPAELGGPGFTGEGWETNASFLAMGNPDAPQGGSMVQVLPDWPATLRQAGEYWNTSTNYMIRDLCYEGLIKYHWTTHEYIPCLASHWWISEDKKTYRFRIDPRARWSDGTEVTAEDVVATHKLRVDPSLREPANLLAYGKLKPVAKSKYIVEVEAEEANWRNFLDFGVDSVFPAHQISISGTEYLDKFQFAYAANSGPYIVRAEDVQLGQSVTIRRRDDWWAEDNPAWDGLWNIGSFKFVVVKDYNLAFEKMKKGELDYFMVAKAQWWAEELGGLDSIKRGLLVKRKFFTEAPIGFQGIAMNTQRPPLDDLRVRRALCHLYDRKTLIEKLFYNEYEIADSYFQGGIYENPDNVPVPYDEPEAVRLLEEAGWTEKNAEGYRVKDGSELKLALNYRTTSFERVFTVLQEACKRAGIRLELQLLSPATAVKNLQSKDYELMHVNWGALVFPNPETSFHSTLADETAGNNVTALKDPKVDALCNEYVTEYDVAKRRDILRQIDGLVFEQQPYILEWFLPCQRMIFWNKFGMPKWGGLATHDYNELPYCWWVDPDKEKRLAAARDDRSITLPIEETENHFWQAWRAAGSEEPPN